MPHRPRRSAIGLAAALAFAMELGPAGPVALGSSPPAGIGVTPPAAFTRPSQMYLDDRAHADEPLDLAPGSAVTIPYRPSSSAWPVDGRAPRTLSLAGAMAPDGQPAPTGGSAHIAPAVAVPSSGSSADLQREVFGFLGYWGLSDPVDYGGLTTMAYFGLDSTSTGGFISNSGLTGWNSSALTTDIDRAHANGVRVVLVSKCFGWTTSGNSTCTKLLANPTARQTLADNLANAVWSRGVDGVNFDFEPIPVGQSQDFVDLVRRTRAALDRKDLGYELTIDSLGWIGPVSYQQTNGYDVARLTAPGAADAMVIMGYDYKDATESSAGSIDPLGGPTYDLADTIDSYLTVTSPSHVILALPWYGRAWSTTSSAGGAKTVASTAAQPGEPCSATADYAYIVEQLAPDSPDYWYGSEASPFLVYPQAPTACHPQTTDTRELYFDDVQSLGQRYDLINARGLRGTGMWDLSKAVGSDGLHDELYQIIRTKFTDPPSVYDGPPATFTPLGPSRVLDTRSGVGLSGPLKAGTHRTLSLKGLPAGAVAVTVNVTVVGQTKAGYVSVGPDPTDTAATSTLNFPTRDVRANGATVRLGTGGTLNLLYGAPAGATTNLVIDLTGAYTSSASGATFTPLGPSRVLDTRSGSGGAAGALRAGVPQTIQVAGLDGVPAGAVAVTVNVTVVGQTAAGYVSLTPQPTSKPPTSTINVPWGDIRANVTTVPLDANGSLSVVYMAGSGARANLILDLSGYFR